MVNVLISGFQNDEEAKEFIIWFCEQGEQDTCDWFECRQDEGKKVRDGIMCNSKTFTKGKPKQDSNGNWLMDVS